MATIDQLVTDLRTWTAESTTTVADATAAECLNRAIRRLQRKHGYQGSVGSVDLTMTTMGRVPLPVDFVCELNPGVWVFDPSQTDPARALAMVCRTSKAEWVNAISPQQNRDTIFPNVAAPGSNTNQWFGYYTDGGMLVLVPTPTSAITVRLDYVKMLPDLVVGTTPASHNWFTDRYPDVVREGGLTELYKYLHEWEAATAYDSSFMAMAAEAIVVDEAPSMAGPRRTKGA